MPTHLIENDRMEPSGPNKAFVGAITLQVSIVPIMRGSEKNQLSPTMQKEK